MNQLFKTIIASICYGSTLLSFTACSDYLDVSKEVAAQLTTQEVFENPTYTRQWHNNIFNSISEYSYTGSGAKTGFTGVWSSYCDELSSNSPLSWVMVSGFNAATAANHRWGSLYERIRQAMIFLKNAKPLGTDADKTHLSESDIKRMKAEANFFIAYSYFSMFELYGPVSLITEIADPGNPNLDYARVSVDEMVEYIDNLLKDVIESGDLPKSIVIEPTLTGNDRYDMNDMVRPTTVTAMALRAKLWVYAASPLFNGKYQEALGLKNVDGKALFPAYNAEKWGTAKKRLEELFDFAKANGHAGLYYANPRSDGSIDPNQSVYELFQYYNDEILWATGNNGYHQVGGEMENRTNPRDLYSGWSNLCLTANAADAFFTSNGLDIHDAGSGYTEEGFSDYVNVCNKNKIIDKNISNMYVNREPRFYASVVYQGKSWHIQPNNNLTYGVRMAKGEPVGNASADSPRTGYLYYKFKNRSLLNTGNNPKTWARPNVLFRLADFYLYYAEVCNEINAGDPNVVKYLDMVRQRAGIPGYSELAQTGKKNILGDQVLQRKAIQHERQVELLGEGQRYFDIRRWMICDKGQDADQSKMYGMNMNGYSNLPAGDPNSFFTRVVYEKRSWRNEMYLYPISLNEIQKSRLLVQNPGW